MHSRAISLDKEEVIPGVPRTENSTEDGDVKYIHRIEMSVEQFVAVGSRAGKDMDKIARGFKGASSRVFFNLGKRNRTYMEAYLGNYDPESNGFAVKEVDNLIRGICKTMHVPYIEIRRPKAFVPGNPMYTAIGIRRSDPQAPESSIA